MPLNPGGNPGDGLVGAPRALGVVEITISGIGSGVMSASAVPISPGPALDGGASYTLTPVEDGGGPGGIHLEPLSTGSFTHGERGNGGVRYLYATYRVRNADRDGEPYPSQRRNLTLLAAITENSLGETAISRLVRSVGWRVDAAATPGGPPGAGLEGAPGEVVSRYADVLQVLTEEDLAEVQAKAPAGVELLPYGFVVWRDGSMLDRTLPETYWWSSRFDGIVTFAFKVPLQASPEDDPVTISFTALAVDDSEARITQSLEEQTAAGQAVFEARAAALNASVVTLLPGGRYGGSAATRIVCAVRTAGLAAEPSPAATLFPDPGTRSWLLTGGRNLLPTNTDFAAARCGDPWSAPGPSNFVVNGSQSGRMYLGQSYSRDGAVVRTPAANFFPGEEIEVALTTTSGQPFVARYHVGGAPAMADFKEVGWPDVGRAPSAVALGDLNGDGKLDIVATITGTKTVKVLLGDGAGNFSVNAEIAIGSFPITVALGDLNGDGKLDIVATNNESNSVSVLLGDGAGGFSSAKNYGTGASPRSTALGDVNGDGKLDIVVAHTTSNTVGVLLGDGAGGFSSVRHHAAGANPQTVTLGDVNNDGKIDIVAANQLLNAVNVLLGDGTGGFSAAVHHSVGSYPLSVALGDMDGDGNLDMVVANSGSNSVRVMFGDGTGRFSGARDHAVGRYPAFATLGDLNGDGRLDLITANALSDNVSVLLGDGAGGFYSIRHFRDMHVYHPRNLAIGDVDNDGKIDFVVANGTDYVVTVFRNTP
jgi:hypothetical protein